MDLQEAESYYASIGFSRRTGFGERPALLVIDCNHGCSDPAVSSMAIAMVTVLGLNLLGDGLRDLLDPTLRGEGEEAVR